MNMKVEDEMQFQEKIKRKKRFSFVSLVPEMWTHYFFFCFFPFISILSMNALRKKTCFHLEETGKNALKNKWI